MIQKGLLLLFGFGLLGCNIPSLSNNPTVPLSTPSVTVASTMTVTSTIAPLPTRTPTPLPTATATMTREAVTATASVSTPILRPSASPSIIPTTATPCPSLTPTEEVSEAYHTVVGVEEADWLNIRSQPGLSADIVGLIPPGGQDILITGPSEKIGASLWTPIEYEAIEGWVNDRYLADQIGELDLDLAQSSWDTLQAIRQENWQEVAKATHPELGLRFSPYLYLQSTDVLVSADALLALTQTTTPRLWGTQQGSGEPLEMSFEAYYERYIYSADFFFADVIGYNQQAHPSNLLDNCGEIYLHNAFIDYHFEGFNPDYGGMDFRTLRLIFAPYQNEWRLVAIVNDEWTP